MWILQKIRLSHRKKILLSLAASVFFHCISLYFTTRSSVWFLSPVILSQESSGEIIKLNRDQILKEAFTQTQSLPFSAKAKPLLQSDSFLFNPLIVHEHPLDLSRFPISHLESSFFSQEELLSSNQIISFKIPNQERLNLFEHLPKDLILPAPPLSTNQLPEPKKLKEESPSLKISSSEISSPPPSTVATSETPLLSTPSIKEDSPLKPPFLFTPKPELPCLPSLAELETSSYSDCFDMDIVFLPREEKEGYIFALTLIPQIDLNLPKIRQNYSFLIDKSNSIQKERLFSMKNAVYRALEELDSDDAFNIIAFDSKINKLSPTPLPYSSESIKAAKEFLDQIELGSFFSTANLFNPLFLTIPPTVKEDELHTAILLTDGELLNKSSAQRSLLYNWTDTNCGRTSLFSLGIGNDPHLSTLETAAAFNRGAMLYSPTKGSIKRKLLKLMKTISYPIAKDLVCRAIHLNGPGEIHLYPKPVQMSHLYLNQPYVILGTTDSLDNFILFIQGRLKDQWIHIKKKVSFTHAKKGETALRIQWALQRAYGCYEQYIYDKNPAHLAEAEALLEPYHLKVAFQ